jgi:excisionase family DNA binding protein
MDVGSLLSVSEAAAELGVNHQRVRAFIADGRLPAMKLGTDWRVSVADLSRLSQVERRPGRPLSPGEAWQLLEHAEEDGQVRVKRGRVLVDAFQIVHLVRRRAEVHRLHVLDRLADDVSSYLVAGGESAARHHGFAPHSTKLPCDGYVRQSMLGALMQRYALAPAIGEDINVWLRAVDDDVWPFDASRSAVGPLVAAIDMAGDPIDDRSVDAALPIIERYL